MSGNWPQRADRVPINNNFAWLEECSSSSLMGNSVQNVTLSSTQPLSSTRMTVPHKPAARTFESFLKLTRTQGPANGQGQEQRASLSAEVPVLDTYEMALGDLLQGDQLANLIAQAATQPKSPQTSRKSRESVQPKAVADSGPHEAEARPNATKVQGKQTSDRGDADQKDSEQQKDAVETTANTIENAVENARMLHLIRTLRLPSEGAAAEPLAKADAGGNISRLSSASADASATVPAADDVSKEIPDADELVYQLTLDHVDAPNSLAKGRTGESKPDAPAADANDLGSVLTEALAKSGEAASTRESPVESVEKASEKTLTENASFEKTPVEKANTEDAAKVQAMEPAAATPMREATIVPVTPAAYSPLQSNTSRPLMTEKSPASSVPNASKPSGPAALKPSATNLLQRIGVVVRGTEQMVRLDIRQGAGSVRVMVHCDDSNLATSLRQSLPDLIQNLSGKGFDARVTAIADQASGPAKISQPHKNDTNSQNDNRQEQPFENRPQERRRHPRGKRPVACELQDE